MIVRLTTLLLMLSWVSGCSTVDPNGKIVDANSAKGAYLAAMSLEKDERFEEAIAHYSDLKNKYPYSRYATLSELRVAEIHFDREEYLEAENAYKLFKEFHPRHSKIDYVTFRLAMSLYRQLPTSIDRDLSLAHRSIQYFEEVYNSYPNSDYAGSAKDHRKKAFKKLAQKEYYIAHFYYIREMYDSALLRYEHLLKKYRGLGLTEQTLYHATKSAHKLKRYQKAKRYYNALMKNYPNSQEAKNLKLELADGI